MHGASNLKGLEVEVAYGILVDLAAYRRAEVALKAEVADLELLASDNLVQIDYRPCQLR